MKRTIMLAMAVFFAVNLILIGAVLADEPPKDGKLDAEIYRKWETDGFFTSNRDYPETAFSMVVREDNTVFLSFKDGSTASYSIVVFSPSEFEYVTKKPKTYRYKLEKKENEKPILRGYDANKPHIIVIMR